ncbi:hypothetical protein BC629DRAFT_1302075 [Irpex lacteus]|nr:hypothetical protein BC629DRAFT_1302075 [Irpex lacteus]
MKPDLRREFQHLEILAAATDAEFNGDLPFSTVGQTRSYVVRKFQEWKGIHYVPPDVHPAINWSNERTTSLLPPPIPPPWKPIVAEASAPKVPAKRKSGCNQATPVPNKLTKLACAPLTSNVVTPSASWTSVAVLGFRWDSQNWSCAYDVLFTVLFNLYREDRLRLAIDTCHDLTDALQELWVGFAQLKALNVLCAPDARGKQISTLSW